MAGHALADPAVYADEYRLHEVLTLLRENAPVHWVEPPGYRPFWAVTRHADIVEIERAHHAFLNGPRPVLMPASTEQTMAARGSDIRTLIHVDGPDHRRIRAAGTGWFTPQALDAIRVQVCELATQYVDTMAGLDGSCDFAVDVAKQFSLSVILSLLGLPESDFQTILALTQGMRGDDPDGAVAAQEDLFDYFRAVAADRMSHPTDDLASTIANARVNGRGLPVADIVGYFISIATAGHDTTGAVLSGG